MELSSDALATGIVSTQVGYPLAHGGEGPSHSVSADRDAGLALSTIPDAEDEQVGDPGFGRADLTEGRGDLESLAERGPEAEDLGLGLPMLDSGSSGGEVERSAEISREDISVGSWSSRQGRSWG